MAVIQQLLASYGGVPKTYATWNPSDKSSSINLSGGNLNASSSNGSTWQSARATLGKTSGKWYWEVTALSINTSNDLIMVGVATTAASLTNAYIGLSSNGWSWYNISQKFNGSSSAYGTNRTSGDVIGIAVDIGGNSIEFYKNNISAGVAFTNLSGTIYPAMSIIRTVANLTTNFGATTMTYTAPLGYNQGFYN